MSFLIQSDGSTRKDCSILQAFERRLRRTRSFATDAATLRLGPLLQGTMPSSGDALVSASANTRCSTRYMRTHRIPVSVWGNRRVSKWSSAAKTNAIGPRDALMNSKSIVSREPGAPPILAVSSTSTPELNRPEGRGARTLIQLVSAIALAAVTLGLAPATAKRQAAEETPLRIQMTVSRIPTTAVVTCELRFDTSVSVRVSKADLPWNNHYSATWVAVVPGGPGLRRSLPVEDPSPEIIVVKPGSILQGRVDLSRQFPSFSADARSEEIVVFWTYRLETEDGVSSNRVAGWLSFEPERK